MIKQIRISWGLIVFLMLWLIGCNQQAPLDMAEQGAQNVLDIGGEEDDYEDEHEDESGFALGDASVLEFMLSSANLAGFTYNLEAVYNDESINPDEEDIQLQILQVPTKEGVQFPIYVLETGALVIAESLDQFMKQHQPSLVVGVYNPAEAGSACDRIVIGSVEKIICDSPNPWYSLRILQQVQKAELASQGISRSGSESGASQSNSSKTQSGGSQEITTLMVGIGAVGVGIAGAAAFAPLNGASETLMALPGTMGLPTTRSSSDGTK